MLRLFVGIDLPPELKLRLSVMMGGLPGAKWVDSGNLHLTLRFIGEVERPVANDVAASLTRIRFPPFDLRINGIGRFDRRSGGALWAGVEPRKPVAELAAKVDRACVEAGLEPERRAFHPHITLARYNRRGAAAAAEFERRFSGLSSDPFQVANFVLFESRLSRHGAHYEPITSCELR